MVSLLAAMKNIKHQTQVVFGVLYLLFILCAVIITIYSQHFWARHINPCLVLAGSSQEDPS